MRMKTVLVAGVPLLWLATLASSVAVIYVRHRAGDLTFELSQERAHHERLLVAFGQLQIEKNRHGAAVDGAHLARPPREAPEGASPP